jgi:hypothetical protein
VIIDVGVETYTAKTFSEDRYSIWTMQSAYHNLPTINGVMPKDGREYQASDVKFVADDRSARFSLDIARAYPPDAKVKSWIRRITLDRGKDVVISDRYELEQIVKPFTLSLMTSCVPSLGKDGVVSLRSGGGEKKGRSISLLYDGEKFSVAIEPIKIEDTRLRSSWGEQIYRIVLTSKVKAITDEYTLAFREE